MYFILPFFILAMRRTINNTNLTKEFILSKISQVSIFSVYTGVDSNIIEDCINTGNFISSPFREDVHPSFGFRYNNRGKLKGKDFAGYFHGDCFDAAAYVLSEIIHKNIDISDKQWFIFVLRHIAYTFRHIIYGKEKDPNIENIINTGIKAVRCKKPIIEFVPREWNTSDINFWNSFGISINYLNTEFVYPVDQYYINRKINPEPKYYYDYDRRDPCYAYVLGKDNNGIYNIKLYFPKRKKGTIRFITNSNIIEGIITMGRDKYDYIVITKSTKDRISLKQFIDSIELIHSLRGIEYKPIIGVVNIPHESYKLRQIEYDWLKSKCPNGIIISLMDNDSTGCREAIWLKQSYNIIPFIIPKHYSVKDFAELRNKYSIDTIKDIINKTFKYIIENYENVEPEWYTKEDNTLYY